MRKEKDMFGLLYPAYQKFYSAISCLERFNKEQDFFENISCLDTFFSEYRSITLVMQKSLAHTPYIDTYKMFTEKVIGALIRSFLKNLYKVILNHSRVGVFLCCDFLFILRFYPLRALA